MTSAISPKLPPVEAEDKDAYPLSTGRVHPKARKLIDIAAAHSEVTRADFLAEAGFAAAIAVVGADAAQKILNESVAA